MNSLPARSVGDVLRDLIDVLEHSEEPLTTKEIAQARGLDWKTTEKYLEFLSEFTKRGRLILLKELPRAKLWKLERLGLLSLPEEEQTRIVRGYFPKPSAEESVLARLLLAGATSSETAVNVGRPVSELVEAGWVRSSRRGRGHYLTGLGLTIARGAVKTYPELASRTR